MYYIQNNSNDLNGGPAKLCEDGNLHQDWFMEQHNLKLRLLTKEDGESYIHNHNLEGLVKLVEV